MAPVMKRKVEEECSAQRAAKQAAMRFLDGDPLGYDGKDANLYRYVGNDPINETDPSGLQPGLPSTPGNPAPMPRPPFTPDNAIGGPPGLGGVDARPAKQIPTNVDFFRAAGEKNKIKSGIIEGVIQAGRNTGVIWCTWNQCLTWVQNFQTNLNKKLNTPDFAPLKGTGITGEIRTFEIDANFGLTNSHAAYLITFPDGSKFYFDNGSLSGKMITLPSEIPSKFKNEK